MRLSIGAFGLVFLATVAVYNGPANSVNSAKAANTADVSAQQPADSSPATQPSASTDTSAANNPAAAPSNDAPANGNVVLADASAATPGNATVTSSDTGGLSIHTDEMPVDHLLRLIAREAHVNIVPSKEVRGSIPPMDLDNVTVHEALDAILPINGFYYQEKGNFIYVYSAKEWEDLRKQTRQTEVFRLFYAKAADVAALIKPHLSTDAEISTTAPITTGLTSTFTAGGAGSGGSGSSSSSDTGGNNYSNEEMLVITDDSDHLDKIRQIIKEVDRKPRQVLVEATILSAQLTDDNQFGVNWSIAGTLHLSGLTSVAASTGFSLVPGGFSLGVTQNNVSVMVNALESVANTTVLANPKVLTLDKQQGQIQIGTTLYYFGQSTTTETTTTQSVQSLATGINLDFRPFIGDDGYIRMEIEPQDIDIQSGGNGLLASGLPAPTFNTSVASNVMVKDGETIVLGGLFKDSGSTTKSQVPLLGSVPFAGQLFRQQDDSTTRQEVIFLLTPHIVKDDSVFGQLSEQEARDIERLRVGTRQGMMPWGRERLAESCYVGAQQELHKAKPDLCLVRFYLDCATDLNPTFLEALDLKEKVTGKQLAMSDNSSIRSFVRREMLEDRLRAQERSPDQTLLDDEPRPALMPIIRTGPTTTSPTITPQTNLPPTPGAQASPSGAHASAAGSSQSTPLNPSSPSNQRTAAAPSATTQPTASVGQDSDQ
jgi:type IV pilus assembly protein PilQ